MTFGQQPGHNQGQSPYQVNNNAQMSYGQPYAYGAPGAGPVYNTQATYSMERAQHVSMTKAYGEMTIGLIVTAVVAFLTQASGFYMRFLMATNGYGMWILAIAQIALAFFLGFRVMKMSPTAARVGFYAFAALMGVTMSTIFLAFDIQTIFIAFAICAGFFFALTMFGLTTKANMLKAGPVLMIGLIVLIIAEVIIMFVSPGNTALMAISAIGLVLFAGLTIYDAQFTRQVFAQYASYGPDMIKKVSILCALNLYLDFINMFMYILQLVGGSRD